LDAAASDEQLCARGRGLRHLVQERDHVRRLARARLRGRGAPRSRGVEVVEVLQELLRLLRLRHRVGKEEEMIEC
jgi:hypothetical protein